MNEPRHYHDPYSPHQPPWGYKCDERFFPFPQLLQWFKPRLVLSGHTHSGCQVLHDNQYTEISVPSFNWRNRNNPSFILGSFSPSGYGLSKCFLPEESTVIALYCSTGASLLLLPLVHCLWIRGLLRCLNFCPISKHKSL
uniref:Metallophosphoesterase 1 n=1 Tax=Hucho hucho TaxID=62062 RepID=A0A4W5MC69_9TELE